MDSAPALPPPAGGDVNKSPALLAIFWTEAGIATLFVLTRAIVRTLNRNWGWDDYTMVATWALYVGDLGLASQLVLFGLGRHMAFLSPGQIAEVVKWNWITQAPGIIALGMTKVTITLLLLRVMGPNSVWRKRLLMVNAGFFMIVCVLAAIFSYVQCNPPRALWEPVPDAKCWNPASQADFATFTSAYASFCDFLLALMPISFIWPLNMSIQKKVGLCFLLGLGIFSGICAAIKTTKASELGARSDVTWVSFDLYAWTSSEIFLNIVCGCVPACKPVFDRIVHKKPIRQYRRSEGADSYQMRLKASSKAVDGSGTGLTGPSIEESRA